MFPTITPDAIPDNLKIRCHKIEPGTDVEGFIIGPIVVAVVHWSGKASKPCPHAMSAGVLDCPCLRDPMPKRKIGYLPMQTFRGERIAVILSNLVALRVIKLPQGTAVKIFRPKIPCAPLSVSELGDYAYSSTAQQAVRKREALNIQPWLLHLWNHEVLRRYYLEPNAEPSRPPTEEQPVHSPIPHDVSPSTKKDGTIDPPSKTKKPKKSA